MFGPLLAFCYRTADFTQCLRNIKPDSVMCGWKVTVQTRDTCSSLVYKANEVEPHVDVEYTKRLQLSSHMSSIGCIFIAYFTVTKMIWVLTDQYCLENLRRFENLFICVKWHQKKKKKKKKKNSTNIYLYDDKLTWSTWVQTGSVKNKWQHGYRVC